MLLLNDIHVSVTIWWLISGSRFRKAILQETKKKKRRESEKYSFMVHSAESVWSAPLPVPPGEGLVPAEFVC